MTQAQIFVLISIVLYMAAMIGIGIYFSKRESGLDAGNFFLGGRKLGPLVTAMSAEASDMSSYLLMGLPGLAYLCGLPEVTWTAIGLAIGTYVNWLVVAKRLRRYSAKINAITIPDFFSRRFGDKKHILSAIAALVILVFFVPYTASGFKAVGTLVNSFFGWDYHTAMIIGAVILVAYTVAGGFMAVSTTDLVQSIIMTVALVIIVIFGIQTAGGIDNVVANAQALPGYLDLTKGFDLATNSAASFSTLSVFSTLAWGLGYFGMPHILLRFMAIRDEKELKTSRRIASVWVVISMFIAVFIGVIGVSISKLGLIPVLGTSAESETVVIQLSSLMSQYGWILALVAGVILAGILAATMSTADSQLLAAASSFSHDIVQDFFGKKLTDKQQVLAARGTVVAISIIAVILAWDANSSVFRVVSFAWAGFGAAFGPTMLLALFWKRMNKQGAIAGMIAGAAMVFIWKYGIATLGGAWSIYELLPAFLTNLIVAVVVSLLTKEPDTEIVETFEQVNQK